MKRTQWFVFGGAILLALALAVPALADKPEKKKVALPEAAQKALLEAFPKAKIEEVEQEDEHGIQVFEVELERGKEEFEVSVSADGLILEIETEVQLKDLPEAVAKAMQEAATGAAIAEIEKEEIRAEVVKDDQGEPRILTLETPRVVYEAELRKDDQVGEIEVAADGKVLEPLKWKTRTETKHDDADGDDDDDDASDTSCGRDRDE